MLPSRGSPATWELENRNFVMFFPVPERLAYPNQIKIKDECSDRTRIVFRAQTYFFTAFQLLLYKDNDKLLTTVTGLHQQEIPAVFSH